MEAGELAMDTMEVFAFGRHSIEAIGIVIGLVVGVVFVLIRVLRRIESGEGRVVFEDGSVFKFSLEANRSIKKRVSSGGR